MVEVPGPASPARADVVAEIGALLDVGVLTVNERFIVTGWNDWLARATGRPASSVVGRPLTEVEPNLRPAARAAFERALHGSVVVMSHALHGFLIDARAPAGHDEFARMQQSVRILPLDDPDGGIRGAAAFIEDVTERVAREDALRAALEDAQAANQAKSNFLTAMSHELRTPIGAISGYADLVADGIFGPVNDTQRDHLHRVKAVSAHLLSIVEEILAFARINARREEVHLTDVDAVSLAYDAFIAVQPLAAKKGLAIENHLPDALPMHTDAVKVRQILINLLGNAVKFTSAGSVTLDVTATESRASFVVSDTGPGIDAKDVARIFDPFIQVRSTNFKPQGTGLGLSVSRELARLLGGDITLASEVGVGSQFTLTLPR